MRGPSKPAQSIFKDENWADYLGKLKEAKTDEELNRASLND